MQLPDAPPESGVAPDTAPQPPVPEPTPPPAPEPAPTPPEVNPYDDLTAQRAGARKALLTSSVTGATESDPEKQSKVLAIADRLGISADVAKQNYDYLNRAVQLRDVDYNRLLAHHPELSSWLAVPENASVAHQDIPVLQTLDRVFQSMDGKPRDPTGILPDGYMFKADGTIRGPLHLDGAEPIIYKNFDALRAKFAREEGQQVTDRFLANAAAERLNAEHWMPSLAAGVEASIASTHAAIARATGGRWSILGQTGEELSQGSAALIAGSRELNPSIGGEIGRTVGSLIGDAPLYLLGGEAAGIADLAASARAIGAGAKAITEAPRSEYLLDAFKAAAAYSPVAARSGINSGSDNGTAYGLADFLLNSAVPGAFGSRFGLARAIVPGQETAAAGLGWLGASGRILTHVGAQGGIQATTELANAIHERVTGVDPDALKSETLVPRLARAGAMGAVLAGAFHLPGAIGEQVQREQIASQAALHHADRLGEAVELIQAAKVAQYSPQRTQELLSKIIPAEERTKFFQTEDWDGIAKDAGMTPDDLAEAMNVEEQYRLAKTTGQAMQVPTADLLQKVAGMEKPEAITSALLHARQVPEGRNGVEGVAFFKEKPEEIDAMVRALKNDVTEQAKAVTETDPIYKDFLGKVIDAGRPVDEAKRDARLMAAFFNVRAERWNESAAERGATKIDALTEYQRYQLRVQTEAPGHTGIEPLDAMLDRIRKGDIPKRPRGDLEKMTKGEVTPETIENAHAEGHINEATPEALRAALEAERDAHPIDQIREALTGLQTHLASRGIDIAKSNAEIKALLAGEELPAVKEFEQRLEVPSNYLRHEYLLKQWKKAHGDRTPTPTDKDWQKLRHQADMVDEANGRKYEQPGDKAGPRGSISYNAERHFLITLTGKANLSTVLHESGHFFLEVMGDYAERDGAPEQFKTDYAQMLKFLGVEKRSEIGIEQHEKWARAVEQYLMEGHAPSPELRGVFQRFAIWLSHLYRKVKALVRLTPEVRRVFDRLLATDEAIKRASEDLGTSTIFKDQESSGMTDREWTAYLKDIRSERERSFANVFNQAMRTLRRENTKAYRKERAAAMEEAAGIVNARPVHIAESYLVDGRGPDGKDLPEKPKIDRAEIERLFGQGTIHKLPRGITAEGGMSLQTAADLFGFKTGEELWTALANLPDRKAEIKKLTDGILQARHPDLIPENMLDQAMQAVHANSAHADVLGRESAALAIKAGRRAIPQEQIKSIAEGIVSETNHRDINPNLHLRAQQGTSRTAADALLAKPPDYTAALLAKQREELSHALYRASMEAKEVIGKADDLMRTVKKTKTRQMLGKAGGQTWMVTDANGMVTPFMEQVAAAEAAKEPGSKLSRGPGFLLAMDQLREVWNDAGIRLDMDYGAVADFYDAARSIMHQAREAFNITVEGKREALEGEVTKGLRTENDVRKEPIIKPRSLGTLDKAGQWFAKFDAAHRKLSFVARQLDGEKDGGWHWERLVRPLNKASDDEQGMRLTNAQKLDELYKAWGKTGASKREFIPAVNDWLSLEARIMVALNVGSSKNLERLMTGEGWTREQVQAITNTLDVKDWAFVKGVWDHINSYWPAISEMKTRIDGIPPEKRDSILVETPHGTIEGRYFPIVYDPNLSARSLELSLQQQQKPVVGKPSSGFTEAAAESTGLRLSLDSSSITRHLNAVAHYLSHAETIADLNKLVNNGALSQNIIDRFGMETYKVIRDTIQDVARGTQGPQNVVEKALRFLRTRSGMAVMGFNVMSGATQVFGMTQAMERVGAGAYIRAQGRILESAMSAESASKWVASMSPFMANRAQNQILETMESHDRGALDAGPGWLRDHAYWLMHKTQWLVDLPTWMAAHENAVRDFPGDDAKAVALADQAVIDTQGTGLTKDQARLQRSELGKMLLQFGGFFNSTYNLGRNRAAATDFSDPASVARLGGSLLLLVSLPAVAMAAFKESVRASPEDDGSPSFWLKRLAKDHLGYLLSTMVLGRELSGALDGFDYSGPAGMRSLSVLSGLVKQIGQVEPTTGNGLDKGLGKAALMTAGVIWGIPAVQVQRVIDGILYDSEHGTKDPRPLLFGPPR